MFLQSSYPFYSQIFNQFIHAESFIIIFAYQEHPLPKI
jgi:hypothetical protein